MQFDYIAEEKGTVQKMCLPLKIVRQGGTGEVTEKKSRFIASVFPICSEEEALEYISNVKKKHYNARHNCFAYVLGEKNETERCSDDGEPSGTAGRPMLDVLTGQGIHDALVVVTRYFGGTLLGTGGLVRAYSAAVKAGLEASVIQEKIRGYHVNVQADYNNIGKIQYIAAGMDIREETSEYGEKVMMIYEVPEEKISVFEREITEKTSGQTEIDRGEKSWIYLNI